MGKKASLLYPIPGRLGVPPYTSLSNPPACMIFYIRICMSAMCLIHIFIPSAKTKNPTTPCFAKDCGKYARLDSIPASFRVGAHMENVCTPIVEPRVAALARSFVSFRPSTVASVVHREQKQSFQPRCSSKKSYSGR